MVRQHPEQRNAALQLVDARDVHEIEREEKMPGALHAVSKRASHQRRGPQA